MHRGSTDVVGDPPGTPTQEKLDREPIWAKTQHTCSTHPCGSANQHDHVKREAELRLALWIGPKLQQFSSGAGSCILVSYLMLEPSPRNTG